MQGAYTRSCCLIGHVVSCEAVECAVGEYVYYGFPEQMSLLKIVWEHRSATQIRLHVDVETPTLQLLSGYGRLQFLCLVHLEIKLHPLIQTSVSFPSASFSVLSNTPSWKALFQHLLPLGDAGHGFENLLKQQLLFHPRFLPFLLFCISFLILLVLFLFFLV